jgi:hypothetical protein
MNAHYCWGRLPFKHGPNCCHSSRHFLIQSANVLARGHIWSSVPVNDVAVADLVSALGSVPHASLHILDAPTQLVCKAPFRTAMGIL